MTEFEAAQLRLQEVQALILAVGLLGVLFAGWTLFSGRRWTRVQVVLELDRRWESEPLFSARRHVARKMDEIRKNLTQQGLAQMEVEERIPEELHSILAQLRQNNLEEYTHYMAIPNFFESVGALADRGDAYRLWAGAIVGYYNWFGRHINARREAERASEMYQEFVGLARWCGRRRTGTE